MTAYLDNNILIYLENGTLTISELKDRISHNLTDFLYSSAHIQETEEIKGESDLIRNERIDRRLKTIGFVTDSKYLYHNLDDGKVYLLKKKPQTVLDTIRDVPFAKAMMKGLINMIGESEREQFRLQLGLNAKRLNNYDSIEVVEHLNTKLNEWGNMSLIEMIEKGVELHPQGKEFGLHNRIAGIFELLDMLGYWTDKYNEKSNYARLWDSNHVYFASLCDFFISDDIRTRNKAKVVYDIYNIKTIISSSKGIT
jgi:hypothetical protein